MHEVIQVNGQGYSLVSDAAKSSGLSHDYISRLCRAGKVGGHRIGKNWYVQTESFANFLATQNRLKSTRNEQLSSERKHEYRSAVNSGRGSTASDAQVLTGTTDATHEANNMYRKAREFVSDSHVRTSLAVNAHASARFVPALFSNAVGIQESVLRTAAHGVAHVPAHVISPLSDLMHKMFSLALAFTITFGLYSYVNPAFARHAMRTLQEQRQTVHLATVEFLGTQLPQFSSDMHVKLVTAAENPVETSSQLSAIAVSGFGAFTESLAKSFHKNVNVFVESIFTNSIVLNSDGSESPAKVSLEVQPFTRDSRGTSGDSSAASELSSGAQGSAERNLSQGSVQIQRIAPTYVTYSGTGISETILNARLQELENSFASRIAAITYGNSTSIVNNYNVAAQSNAINKLGSVVISDSTFTGGTISGATISGGSVTATAFSGLLGISSGGTGTSTAPAYGQVLLGNASGEYDLVATSSLGIAASGGVALTDANTWTALQLFSAGASSTNFSNFGTAYFGGSATSTFDSAGALSLAAPLATSSGGTGISSYSVGDMLYVNSVGTLARLAAGSAGQVIKISGGVPSWGADATGGGGAGAFATSSDSLLIYPTDTDDVLVLGASATSTTGNIFEVLGNSLLRGALTAYNTITAPVFTATSTTAASTFPYASSTALTVSGTGYFGTASTTNLTVSGAPGGILKTSSVGAVSVATAGVDYENALTFSYPFSRSANTISLAFGTTTSNTWAGTQTFTNTISGSITGNAGTATALQTSRAINGTAFDGTQDITITAASSTLLVNSNTFSGSNIFTQTITGDISGNAGTVTNGVYTTTFNNLFDPRFITQLAATTSVASITTLSNLSILSSQVSDLSATIGASYPFAGAGNSTSTLTQFNGGLTAFASSTIGSGSQAGGLTISGGATTTGNLVVQGSATSTFANGLSATFLNITGTAATSTFASGINLSAGCFSINGTCVGGSSGASLSAANSWTALQSFAAGASTTQLSVFGKAYFGGTATTTIDSAGNLSVAGTSVFTGLASFTNASTTRFSIFDRLYVGGTATTTILGSATSTFGAGIETSVLNITGTAATSTFASGINLSAGCFSINGTCVGGASGASLSAANSWTALQSFAAGASTTQLSVFGKAYFGGTATTTIDSTGAITVASNSANTFPYASTTALSVSGTAYFAGSGIWNSSGNVGIGTSTPWGNLTIAGTSGQASTSPLFAIGSSTSLVGGAYASISGRGSALFAGRAIDPEMVGETQGTTPGTTLDGAVDIFVSGKYAYVTNNTRDSLAVIDISNPANPTFIAETRGPTPGTTLDGALGVFVSGKYAYVANNTRDSLAVIDISNPANPTFIAETRGTTPGTTLDGARGVFVSGKYAYVTNQTRDSLAVIDISNPANPTFIAETQGPTPGTSLDSALGVFVSGKYAYVANNARDSLAVIDISNPANPTFIAETQGTVPGTTLDGATKVFISGKYAYVANQTRDSLAVIDISNPANPTFIAETRGTTPGTTLDGARGVFVSGKYAYVSTGVRDSLAVIDISNPAAPTFIAETQGTTPGTSLDSAFGVFVSGKYAYVANNTRDSLAVIDIGGLEASTLYAGNIQTDSLQVDSLAVFGSGLGIGGGLNVGGDSLFNGALSISGSASTTSSNPIALAVTKGNSAFGTSTPYSKLTVWGNSTGNIFEAVTSASTTALRIAADGFATTTLSGLSINGSATSTSNVGFDITTGCFSINGTCVGGSSGASLSAANSWTALQSFAAGASTTQFSVFGKAYFGGTATTTIDSTGAITVASNSANTFPYASTTALSVSGTAYFAGSGIWDASGNVGIGTTTPSANLVVNGTTGQNLFQIATSTNQNVFTIRENGYVNIGGASSAAAVLNVKPLYGTGYTGTISSTLNGAEVQIRSALDASASAGDYTGIRLAVSGNGSGVALAGIYAVREAAEGDGSTSLTFGTRGSSGSILERLRINSGGNIGVGTTTPDQKLVVADSTTPILKLVNTDVGISDNEKVGSFQIYSSDGSSGGSGIVSEIYTYGTGGTGRQYNTAFDVWNNGTTNTALTLQYNGNVGIGTTSPLAKLSVHANSGETNLRLFEIASSTASATSTLFVVTNTGNVGIGTTTPQTPLSVSSSGSSQSSFLTLSALRSASGSQVGIDFRDRGSVSSVNGGQLAARIASVRQAATGLFDLAFSTSPSSDADATEKMRILANGNVGIGTTSPFRKFSVAAAAAVPQVAIEYDTGNSASLQVDSTGDLVITSSGQNVLLNDDNFLVCASGCPSDPTGSGKLYVETSAGIGTTTPAYKLTIETQDSTTNFLQVASSTAQSLFVINANGRIGVGTSTPFSKFTVGAGGAITTVEKTLSDSATIAVNWLDGNQQNVVLGGNRAITFSNYIAGQILRLVVCQDGTGSRTLTWPSSVRWQGGSAPTLTTTANQCDLTTFVATNGTSTLIVLGAAALAF